MRRVLSKARTTGTHCESSRVEKWSVQLSFINHSTTEPKRIETDVGVGGSTDFPRSTSSTWKLSGWPKDNCTRFFPTEIFRRSKVLEQALYLYTKRWKKQNICNINYTIQKCQLYAQCAMYSTNCMYLLIQYNRVKCFVRYRLCQMLSNILYCKIRIIHDKYWIAKIKVSFDFIFNPKFTSIFQACFELVLDYKMESRTVTFLSYFAVIWHTWWRSQTTAELICQISLLTSSYINQFLEKWTVFGEDDNFF